AGRKLQPRALAYCRPGCYNVPRHPTSEFHMGCLLEIGLLIYGIVILARGEMSLGGGRVARGAPAYFAGLLFIFPLPAALMLGVFLGLTNPQMFAQGPLKVPIELVLAEWGLIIGCLVLGLIIGYANGQPAGIDRRSRRDDEDDYHRRRDEDYDRDRDRGRSDHP